MTRHDRWLVLAGLTALADAALAAAGLTVSIVAASHSAADSIPNSILDDQWALSILNLLGAGVAIACVALRRPLWKIGDTRWRLSRFDTWLSIVAILLCGAFLGRAMNSVVTSLQLSRVPLAERPSIGPLALGLNLASWLCWMSSLFLFRLWWTRHPQSQSDSTEFQAAAAPVQ